MGVLTADKDVERGEDTMIEVPVTDDEIIYKGALVCTDTDGYALAAADTANYKFIGIAYDKQDNTGTGHADGAKKVRVYRRGIFKLVCTGIMQSQVGQLMYVKDDQTVDDSSTNWICVGRLVKFVSTYVGWVDIGDRAGGFNLISGDQKLYFRNTNCYIFSPSADRLTIEATATHYYALTLACNVNITGNLRMGGDKKVEFRGTGNYIHSLSTDVLNIVAAARVYLKGNAGFYNDIIMSSKVSFANNARFASDKRLEFRNANCYIYSPAADRLTIEATATHYYALTIACNVSLTGNIRFGTTGIIEFTSTSNYIKMASTDVMNIVAADRVLIQGNGGHYYEIILAGNVQCNDNVRLTTDGRLEFRDATVYLYSDAVGELNIVVPAAGYGALYLQANLKISGTIMMGGIPASDPGQAGAIYADSGDGHTLKRSAG